MRSHVRLVPQVPEATVSAETDIEVANKPRRLSAKVRRCRFIILFVC